MRLSRRSPVLILFGLMIGWSRASEPATLSLEQAVASVERVNLTVLLGREAVVQAVEQARISRSAILPAIAATAQQRRQRTVTVNGEAATATGPVNRYDAVVSGSYSLLDPARWSAARSANVGIEITRADYDATLQLILSGIIDAYFAHLRNLRRLDVLDANIERAKSLLLLAENQFRAGAATQIDVTRAEAQLAQAEQARLQQETVDYQSEMTLKRALDLDPAQPLVLQRVELPPFAPTGRETSDDRSIFRRRADYLRAEKAVEQARIDVRTATFERLPSLALGAQYGEASPGLDQGNRKQQWFAGATVTLPVFSGFRVSADRQYALSRLRTQEARLHFLEQQISAELRLAWQDANSRGAQIAMAEKNLQLARDQLRLARERYQHGVADNREVVEAQAQLAVAEDTVVEAGYQYNLSRVELASAQGDVRRVLPEPAR